METYLNFCTFDRFSMNCWMYKDNTFVKQIIPNTKRSKNTDKFPPSPLNSHHNFAAYVRVYAKLNIVKATLTIDKYKKNPTVPLTIVPNQANVIDTGMLYQTLF